MRHTTPTRRQGLAVLPALLIACAGLAGPAGAESLASSAASLGSASVGSLSDSIQGSSNSSSRDAPVAQGEYRIVAVTELAAHPDRLRLTMAPVAPAGAATGFDLILPRETFAAQGLATGDRVSVRHRAYGLAFGRADQGEPFYLVLAEPWPGELEPRAVRL